MVSSGSTYQYPATVIYLALHVLILTIGILSPKLLAASEPLDLIKAVNSCSVSQTSSTTAAQLLERLHDVARANRKIAYTVDVVTSSPSFATRRIGKCVVDHADFDAEYTITNQTSAPCTYAAKKKGPNYFVTHSCPHVQPASFATQIRSDLGDIASYNPLLALGALRIIDSETTLEDTIGNLLSLPGLSQIIENESFVGVQTGNLTYLFDKAKGWVFLGLLFHDRPTAGKILATSTTKIAVQRSAFLEVQDEFLPTQIQENFDDPEDHLTATMTFATSEAVVISPDWSYSSDAYVIDMRSQPPKVIQKPIKNYSAKSVPGTSNLKSASMLEKLLASHTLIGVGVIAVVALAFTLIRRRSHK